MKNKAGAGGSSGAPDQPAVPVNAEDPSSKPDGGNPQSDRGGVITFPPLRCHYPDDKVYRQIAAQVIKLLAYLDLAYITEPIITILRELVTNALKANEKRLYFDRLGLDISSEEQYRRAIGHFRRDVINRLSEFAGELAAHNFYIEVAMATSPQGLECYISNNVPILPLELERIHTRIERAIASPQLLEAYETMQDQTEGAGLGIIMTVFLLKNIGVHPPRFEVSCVDGVTKASFFIHKNLQYCEITTSVKKEIHKDLKLLPTFSAVVAELVDLCSRPDTPIQVIIQKVMSDPSLTADVIKFARSANVAPPVAIESVGDAVMAIGIQNLESILMAAGARKILHARYSKFEAIWKHSQKAASLAAAIAAEKLSPALANRAYLAGLLHDIGKIILLSIDNGLTDQIAAIMQDRSISHLPYVEEITIGISHAEIGSAIARFWNFPPYLIETIRHHHSPMLAEEQHRDIVSVVYVADMLMNVDARQYEFSFFEGEVLRRLGMEDPAEFERMRELGRQRLVE